MKKPNVRGKVLNAKAVPIDEVGLVFSVNDGAVETIEKVYSQGRQVTSSGKDFATVEDLKKAEIIPGCYATCIAEGAFRVAFNLGGEWTADVVGPDFTQLDRIEALLSDIAHLLRVNNRPTKRAAFNFDLKR